MFLTILKGIVPQGLLYFSVQISFKSININIICFNYLCLNKTKGHLPEVVVFHESVVDSATDNVDIFGVTVVDSLAGAVDIVDVCLVSSSTHDVKMFAVGVVDSSTEAVGISDVKVVGSSPDVVDIFDVRVVDSSVAEVNTFSVVTIEVQNSYIQNIKMIKPTKVERIELFFVHPLFNLSSN